MEEQKIKKLKDPKYNNSPEYNKAYYAKHRASILQALKTKCTCDNCGRSVSYQRFHEHKKTTYCMTHKKTEIEKYKEQVERLTKLPAKNQYGDEPCLETNFFCQNGGSWHTGIV